VSAVTEFVVRTSGKGLHDITDRLQVVVRDADVQDGLCSIMVRHTSASLTIQENADPAVQRDMEAWLSRLVVENDPLYTHTEEGPDDMPSHIRSALTSATLAIPVRSGRLALGTWQAVYLWEHRTRGRDRSIVVHVG